MNRILQTLYASIQAKVMGLWTKIRLWTSRAYWESKGITTLRQFFSKLLSIKPRDKTDYYSVSRWLVSKRLAFALVVLVGLASVLYILVFSPVNSLFQSDGTTLPTYWYNSIPLKFAGGKVQILAADGHLAYVGDVADGEAAGAGSL